MTPFVVIGCGKTKRALAPGERCRAVDLYTGPLFLARLAHARALGGPHLILSAAYHVLTPDSEVTSYESDLRRRTKRERKHWSSTVARMVAARAAPAQRIVVLASGPYSAFASHLQDREVIVLGEGMQIGELLAYHRTETARLAVGESPPGLSTEGGVAWWLAEVERHPLTDDDTCEVRGDIMRELLDAYRERENARAA